MDWLSVPAWGDLQHYKHRNPPWIKLHRAVMDDYKFTKLSDQSKAALLLIWLLASQNDGVVPNDAEFIAKRCGLNEVPNLSELIESGFLAVGEMVGGSNDTEKISA